MAAAFTSTALLPPCLSALCSAGSLCNTFCTPWRWLEPLSASGWLG